jgi:hypothetical protein
VKEVMMPTINHLRAAVATAVLTTLAATACNTATAGSDRHGVTEPSEQQTRIDAPTEVPRIYPPTDLYVPGDGKIG